MSLEFSRPKFQGFTETQQSKKLADFLKEILLHYSPNWKTSVRRYNQCLTWIQREDKLLPENSLQAPQVLEYYNYWRTQAGLGAESEVLGSYNFKDSASCSIPPIGWSVLVHNLRSAHNVGSIIRIVDCMGWQSVHISGYSSPPTHKSVKGAAMGAEKWVNIHLWESPLDCLASLEKDTPILALETVKDSPMLEDFIWPSKGLLVLGNEELGIPPDLMKYCTHTVQIPLFGRKASLNVANSFSIAAYSARIKIR